MAERYEVYKCEICGNIVEVLHGGVGTLVCCGQPMKLMQAKKEEEGYEKHLPVLEKKGNEVVVKVGSVPHPMEEKHFIEMIEAITRDDRIMRKYLKPGEKPETIFPSVDIREVREYCNIHGLWAKEIK